MTSSRLGEFSSERRRLLFEFPTKLPRRVPALVAADLKYDRSKAIMEAPVVLSRLEDFPSLLIRMNREQVYVVRGSIVRKFVIRRLQETVNSRSKNEISSVIIL